MWLTGCREEGIIVCIKVMRDVCCCVLYNGDKMDSRMVGGCVDVRGLIGFIWVVVLGEFLKRHSVRVQFSLRDYLDSVGEVEALGGA